MNDLTGADGRGGLEQPRKDGPEILNVIVGNGDDDKAKREFGEVLLVFQIFVNRYENRKAPLRQGHQFAVDDASPSPEPSGSRGRRMLL